MKIAVMGAGSIGIIVGALTAKSGGDVVLVDIDEKNVAALNAKGATVTGFMELNVPVKAVTPDEMSGNYDVVLLTTKQTCNGAALKQLLPHLTADSTVCTLQNGIPEESVASHIGAERTTGGTTGFGATWLEPGVSQLTSSAEVVAKFAFDIGEMGGRITPRLKRVQQVLSAVGNTTIMPNFMGVRWAKLLMNATFSGMSTALGCTFRGVLANPEAMTVLAHIADETIKAAHACGYRLAEIQGVDMEFLELKPGQSPRDKMEFYQRVWGPHDNKASMLQDLEKGRKTEINCINGYVSAKGREHNLPTPCNDFVVNMVTAAEAQQKVPDFQTNLEAARRTLLGMKAASTSLTIGDIEMSKLIITSAITGAVHVPSLSPYLPCTPDQIVKDAVDAHAAGAAVVHIHARDPQTGKPSSDFNIFRDIASRISAQCDAVVCITTGGSLAMAIEERVRPITVLKPELASLNSGSINFALYPMAAKIKQPRFDWEIPYLEATEDLIFSNTFKNFKYYAKAMAAAGTKPELEVYDVGMINNIKHCMDLGVLKPPVYMQFVLGILGGIPATPQNLMFLYETAVRTIGSENFVWSACAAGKAQLPLMAVTMTMGGQTRVGLEDNLYVGPGQLAKGSFEQVQRVVNIASQLSIPIASSDEARAMLGLKGASHTGWAEEAVAAK